MNKKEKSKSGTSKVDEVAVLSEDPDTEGFDLQAGETWIYPTNYTLRDYQYSIIQQALLNNTMVSLPTGLGKTFIAAVVMYNFYRWYPTGKIIFMAPTRPLVKQQIDACYNIMAIPKEVTAELTGTKVQTLRKEVWKEKRVFFVTPQVLQNDLGILNELGTKIKCVVFDEAHKAKGNHAYCEVIRKLSPKNKHFRVLALSATPGSTLNDVLEVIHNLFISHLEIRTDESPDVMPYIFERSLETVVVPLGGKLQQVRDDYVQILEKYTRVLIKHRIITGNCSMLTKGKIFMTMKDYQERSKNNRDRAYSEIMRNLNICITLYHAFEVLVRHGLRGFLSFFEEHAEKPLLRGNAELKHIMEDVSEYLGPAPNVEPLPDGSVAEIPESSKFGHPKFYQLRDILLSHFTEAGDSSSRVIVFCEYRESVMEAYALLLRHKPLVKPRIFLGQGAITQRQQVSVIKAFKEGECNTLISTCIGEEGLDIGDVDLIICFDISNKSPVRMVQRMGRTGRKRQGRVVILVTEGKEQQTLKECLIHKQNLTNHILQSSALYKEMYPQNPRMVPTHITPKCHKMYITVKPDSNPQASKKKSNNIMAMFENISNKKSNSSASPHDCDIEIIEINDRIPTRQEYWNKSHPLTIDSDKTKIDFSKKVGKLRVLQSTGKIGHSKDSKLLVSLLQFAESKMYNIPITQMPVMPSQIIKSTKMVNVPSNDGLKQADIRHMFLKPPSATELMPLEKDVGTTTEEVEETYSNKQILSLLEMEVNSYLATTISDESNCNICENLFDCSQFLISSRQKFDIKTWVEPDISVFDSLTAENLSKFADALIPTSNQMCINRNAEEPTKEETVIRTSNVEDKLDVSNRSITEFNDSDLKYSPFKPPNNMQNMLKKCGIPLNFNDSAFNNIAFTQIEGSLNSKPVVKSKTSNKDNILCTLNVNAFDEAEFTQIKRKSSDVTSNDALTFFNISTLEELFETSCVETPKKLTSENLHLPSSTPRSNKEISDSQETIIYSPTNSMNSDAKNNSIKENICSPILCSFDRLQKLKNRAQKRLFENTLQAGGSRVETCNKIKKIDSNKNISSSDLFSGSEDLFDDSISVSKVMPHNQTIESCYYNSDCRNKESVKDVNAVEDSDEQDIIDTSVTDFENIAFTQINNRETSSKATNPPATVLEQKQQKSQPKVDSLDIGDLIDLSVFGLDIVHSKEKPNNSKGEQIAADIENNSTTDSPILQVNKNLNVTTNKYNLDNKSQARKLTNDNHVHLNDFCDESFFDMFFGSDPITGNESTNKKTANKIAAIGVSNKNDTVEIKNASKLIYDKSKMPLTDGKNLMSNIEWKNMAMHKGERKLNTKEDKIKTAANSKQTSTAWKEHHRNKEDTDEWKEEHIWEFCTNTKIESSNVEETTRKVKNTTKQVKSPEIVDLTTDSPVKDEANVLNTSPTLIKSQLGSIRAFSKSQRSKRVTSQQLNHSSKVGEILSLQSKPIKTSTITTVLQSNRTVKPKTKSKLQLNSKNTQNSITSMGWLEKSSTNSANNNNETPTTNDKHKSVTKSDTISKSQTSTPDDNFDFTFNWKKPPDPVSVFKVSPPISNKFNKVSKQTTPPEKTENSTKVTANSDDSDLDFELPKKSTGWIKPKLKNLIERKKLPLSKNANTNLMSMRKSGESTSSDKIAAKRNFERCPYIDNEAEVSLDGDAVSDSEAEDVDCDDKFEESFVDDQTQNVGNSTTMHALYMQSVRSPVFNRGKFKIPIKRPVTTNIYSQLVDDTENSYVNDSFCVNTEDMKLSQHTGDISELEMAELMLEEQRKNRKKRRKKSDDGYNMKRRRILVISSDSD